MPYLDSLDIANRALWHLGQRPIESIDEDSRKNDLLSDAYDKLRQVELRRSLWKFAKRTVYLRPLNVGPLAEDSQGNPTSSTMILDPKPWSATTTYLPGSVVTDANGLLWTTMVPDNVNNAPGVTTAWERYFGPLSVYPFDSTTSGGYFAGELVYLPGANKGGFVIFVSLVNANTDAPTTATAYDATITYGYDAVVSYSGSQWRSLIAVNLANTPTTPPLAWNTTVTYSTAQTVVGSDGYIYSSIGNGNIGNDPTTTPGSWTNTLAPAAWISTPTLYPSSGKWLPLFAGLKNLIFIYPIGTGPSSEDATKNVYRLPSGFLRRAYIDTKEDRNYNDWDIQGNYLVTDDLEVVFPFIADVTTVTDYDALFCEGLSARMAYETCEELTQSVGKQQMAERAYNKAIVEARLVNAIEREFDRPPIDDYISVRL